MGHVYRWDPKRPRWADVNRWVRIGDMTAYAAAAGAPLLGVKLSEGAAWSGTDEAKKVVISARAHGLIVAGYQYGPAEPEAFLKAFPPAEGCIPVLDFEFLNKSALAWEWSQRVQQAERWTRVVWNAWGRKPWFYAGREWLDAGQPEGTMMDELPWWGPRYGHQLVQPEGVGIPVAWQYSDGKSGPQPWTHAGIKDGVGCDMNALLCTREELLEMAGISSPK